MARSGAFGTTLDPFGKSWGGLGRYNVTGDTIQSLAELEAYAVAVAWGNGVASDEEYLESLRKLRDLENPGTKAYMAAQNKLEDAEYTIGRNKIAAGVNAATNDQERLTALSALLAYDREKLAKMQPNNEQYREQQARIASTEGSIRQTQYGILVELVNNGQGTFEQLLDLARRNLSLSVGQPDHSDWQRAVTDVEERMWDEKLAVAMQDYEHDRATGADVLALLDRRLGMLLPGSPGYLSLSRQREDFAESVRRSENQERDTEAYNKWTNGKMSDASFLLYLQRRVGEEKPGTPEHEELKNRLAQYTFSLGEDKLRYEFDKAAPGSAAWNSARSRLITFYTTYQATLNRGSKEWRTVDLAIRSLRAAKGGSGGSGESGGPIFASDKQIPPLEGMAAVINAPGAPKNLGNLFKINPKNNGSFRWFKMNRDNVVTAVNNGAKTWRFVDLDGKMYDIPLAGIMVSEFDAQYLTYAQERLAAAKTFNARTIALAEVDRVIEQTNRHGGAITMSAYQKQWAELEKEKERAAAGGRIGDYLNLLLDQRTLAAYLLGIPLDEWDRSEVPIDVTNNRNPLLTGDMLNRIAQDMEGLQPYEPNPTATDPFGVPTFNTAGDKILWLYANGYLADLERNPFTGRFESGTYNADQMYVWQDGATGKYNIELVDPDTGYTVDPETGKTIPLYMIDGSHVRVVINDNGQESVLYQPISRPGDSEGNQPANALLVKYRDQAGHPTGTGVLRTSTTRIPVMTMTTTQDGEKQTWYSVDGLTWVMAPQGGVAPVLVPNLGGPVSIGPNGKVMVVVNGKTVEWTPDLYDPNDPNTLQLRADKLFRFWQPQDAANASEAGNGAPGYLMHVRTFGVNEENRPGVDLRDDRHIRESEIERIYSNPTRWQAERRKQQTAEALRKQARIDEQAELQWLRDRATGKPGVSYAKASAAAKARAKAGEEQNKIRELSRKYGVIQPRAPLPRPAGRGSSVPRQPAYFAKPKSPYVRPPAKTTLNRSAPPLKPIYTPTGLTYLTPSQYPTIATPAVNPYTGAVIPPPPTPTKKTTTSSNAPTKKQTEASIAASEKNTKPLATNKPVAS